jgi:hypothetical protein
MSSICPFILKVNHIAQKLTLSATTRPKSIILKRYWLEKTVIKSPLKQKLKSGTAKCECVGPDKFGGVFSIIYLQTEDTTKQVGKY